MKKETLISLIILILGLVFEGLYLMTDSTFWGAKFYLTGAICTVIGLIGLLIFGVLPFINEKLDSTKNF